MTLPSKLKDAALYRDKAYIDGAWVAADGGKTLDVNNPSSAEKIGTVPDMGRAETARAIAAANAAWPAWAKLTARERANIIRKWYELILEHIDDLAIILTMEQGKPIAQAKSEITNGAGFVEWYAEEGRRIYGDVIPASNASSRIVVIKQPIGVTAMVTPWNFPSSMITRKASAALAAGCPVVLKPADLTPYSALALAELAHRAGFPKGVFNVVTGTAKDIGLEMTENPLVRKLSFTGSTAVGKLLMEQCAGTVKKLSLELGGNAPFIVFDDADLDAAVQGTMLSKFRNAGQTCICANRIFVHAKVYDAFVEKFTAAAKAVKVGDGFEDGVEQGPMINDKGLEKVERQLADARAKGAKITTGGNRHAKGGLYFEPTVLTDVTRDMEFFSEETFGPLAPVYRFETEDEVVALANDTEYGLAAYVFTKDMGRSWRMAEKLEYGMVGVNSSLLSTEQAPFGGIKQSGLGREGSKYGIEDFLEIKFVSLGGI